MIALLALAAASTTNMAASKMQWVCSFKDEFRTAAVQIGLVQSGSKVSRVSVMGIADEFKFRWKGSSRTAGAFDLLPREGFGKIAMKKSAAPGQCDVKWSWAVVPKKADVAIGSEGDGVCDLVSESGIGDRP